jgi:hypothetical protein
MWTARKVITIMMGALGAALIVRGVWDGVWPVSIQLVAGVLLLVLAVLRWRYSLRS